MKKRILILFIVIITVISFNACNITKSYPPQVMLGDRQIFLFDPYSYSLGIFDLQSEKWERINIDGCFWQAFGWGNSDNYYVLGLQNKYPFYCGKAADRGIEFLYGIKDTKKSIAPLAVYKGSHLLIEESNREVTGQQEMVLLSSDGSVRKICVFDNLGIMGGVVIGDFLYATCSVSRDLGYRIYKMDLRNPDVSSMELVKDDYGSYKLFSYKDQLLYYDPENNLLYNSDISIRLDSSSDLIYVDSEKEFIAEEHIDSDGRLKLSFTDIKSERSLGVYFDAINFTVEDGQIVVYKEGAVDYIDLK